VQDNGTQNGKRQVSKSIIERVKNKYNVSIAEVDDQDLWQLLTLGITCVSTSGPHANEILSKVVDFIQRSKFDMEMLDYEIEIIHAP
jgi:uncharacterized protein YlxP (DUF503 family)